MSSLVLHFTVQFLHSWVLLSAIANPSHISRPLFKPPCRPRGAWLPALPCPAWGRGPRRRPDPAVLGPEGKRGPRSTARGRAGPGRAPPAPLPPPGPAPAPAPAPHLGGAAAARPRRCPRRRTRRRPRAAPGPPASPRRPSPAPRPTAPARRAGPSRAGLGQGGQGERTGTRRPGHLWPPPGHSQPAHARPDPSHCPGATGLSTGSQIKEKPEGNISLRLLHVRYPPTSQSFSQLGAATTKSSGSR